MLTPTVIGSIQFLVGKQKSSFQDASIFVLKPDWLFLFQSMKRKQKSCQNETSAGRLDAPHTAPINVLCCNLKNDD
jgi:hypothetical protein